MRALILIPESTVHHFHEHHQSERPFDPTSHVDTSCPPWSIHAVQESLPEPFFREERGPRGREPVAPLPLPLLSRCRRRRPPPILRRHGELRGSKPSRPPIACSARCRRTTAADCPRRRWSRRPPCPDPRLIR
ncbi:hypothetical protein SEVIR_4G096750v4 [Setaria viridis]